MSVFGDLTGKKALITGGGRGIGRAIALEFAAAGADVAINYVGSAEEAQDTAAECEKLGVQAFIISADVSKADEVAAMFEQALAQLGRIDILVNNAGITRDALLLRLSDDDYDNVLAVNLRGAFLCMRQAAKLMLKQRSGRIISLSSVVALRGNAGQVNYAASKAGLIGMTKSLARELAGRGVTVNALAPGFIQTAMTDAIPEAAKTQMLAGIPAGRLGQPEDVAAAAHFLASDAAAYITGQVLRVDGGMAM
ncbi:MAG TPA: 3-oxoacyl-[acyl-carrier-protein] reductase [Candidatus Avidehalobacter gallistercoris]|uniref:3-oxoacyl-[acyl-carrier-protein] reductase n=1 Tax=Candidatus Avidehalobacter gallistercoris TaxID=2840694 RepID=A0A9D1HIY7_9FIRM|nr:3-oxoacyl-[acyl-carrier-protein] reductase [Candidatus Avidehalobacter gallistercoris]